MKPAAAGVFERIREAGIMDARHDLPLATLLLQGAEVLVADGTSLEPLVRAPAHMVTHAARDLVRGMHVAMEAMGMRLGIIALKRSDGEAVEAARLAVRTDQNPRHRLEVRAVAPRYPLTPAEVTDPARSALWLDVTTLCLLGDAQNGQRATHRAVTVTGAVERPRTFWIPLGTPYADLIVAAGRPRVPRPYWLLVGGPLTGQVQDGLDGSVTSSTHTLAILPADHRLVRLQGMPLGRMLRRAQETCTVCERCTDLCPVAVAGSPLRPHRIMRALHAPLDHPSEVLAAAQACDACHLCTHMACPADLSPSRLILEVARVQAAAGHPVPAAVPTDRAPLRMTLSRLAARLALYNLDHVAPLETTPLSVSRLVLPLTAGHETVVREGQAVKRNQQLARCTVDSGLVPVYSGADGVVESLGDTIVIKGT